MLKKKLSLFSLWLVLSAGVYAQTTPVATPVDSTKNPAEAPPVVAPSPPPAEQKISWYGFVKHEAFFNSRRSAELREGVVNIYPLDRLSSTVSGADANKDWSDQNNFSSFHMTSVFSRLGLRLSGLNALGGKASGQLETDFMGTGNGTEDILRLRHAYVELDWTSGDVKKGSKLLIGQYWNPMFLSNCFPTVASTTTGIPFHPFGWVPQIKYTYQVAGFSFMGLAYSERALQHVSAGAGTGYIGPNLSTDQTRYSGVPNVHFQVQYANKQIDAGIGIDVSTIRPNLVSTTTGNFAATINNTNITSLSYMAYFKATTTKFIVKGYTLLGTNLNQFVGMGGYAMYKDAATDVNHKYSAQQTWSSWIELIAPSTNKTRTEPAIWFGYMKNLGTLDNLTGKSNTAFVGRGITNQRTFNDFVRIAPRLDVYSGKLKISCEYSYDLINFGNTDLQNFQIISTAPAFTFGAENHRLNIATVYNF